MIGGVERMTERYARRRFSPDPGLTEAGEDINPVITKRIATRGLMDVRIPDLRELVTITLGGNTLVEDDGYSLIRREDGDPAHAIEFSDFAGSYWLNVPGEADLVITGRWGFNPTPDDIKHFVCSLVARQYKKREANFADMIQTGPEGSIFRYMRALPEELRMIIDSYRISHGPVLV
jgi:hypothetical protein